MKTNLLPRSRHRRAGCMVVVCVWLVVLATGSAAGQVSSTASACTCQDMPDIQDRLQKLQAIKQMVLNILGVTAPNTPASQTQWAQLQSGIQQYLQYMQMQNPSAGSTGKTLFNNTPDPLCTGQPNAPTACMKQDYAVHQSVHSQSCHAGDWTWQVPWTKTAMLQEEVAALQLEIDFLQSIKCGLPNNTGTPTAQPPPSQTTPAPLCPQFALNVQVVTTSAMSVPGALSEQSGRSLNGGQGILVPIEFKPDGSFNGVGSGADAGSASGASPGEVVSGRFGHLQLITATGNIQPGSCNTTPCQPDVMHLVLLGGPSQQMSQMQARGVINRNIQQTTPTGAAQIPFDLPAYVGGSAQRTFLATGIVNSNMTVDLLQVNNGQAMLPAGSSLLYSLQQCKATNVAGAAGAGGVVTVPQSSGGGAGVVIPGLPSGNLPPAAGTPAPQQPGN